MSPMTMAETHSQDASFQEQWGAALKTRVQKARRRETHKSLLLVAPVMLVLMLTFLVPIAKMFQVSIYDPTLRDLLPNTARTLDGGSKVTTCKQNFSESWRPICPRPPSQNSVYFASSSMPDWKFSVGSPSLPMPGLPVATPFKEATSLYSTSAAAKPAKSRHGAPPPGGQANA